MYTKIRILDEKSNTGKGLESMKNIQIRSNAFV